MIALASFDNTAEMDQGKGRSGRGDKYGLCDVLAKEIISKIETLAYIAKCKNAYFDWKLKAGDQECTARGVSRF